MKKLINSSILIVVLFLAVTLTASEDVALQEFVQEINKSFSFNSDSPDISIENKYGEVNIVSTSRSDATVEVQIVVEAKSQDRADDIFEKINVDFSNSGNGFSAVTEINSKKGWGWTKKGEKYNVNYTVHLPIRAHLKLKNKYGNISMTDHQGDVDITLKYGHGILNNIDGDVKLNLGYSDQFSMGSTQKNVDLSVSYSNFGMEGAKRIKGDSKYSKLSFDDIEEMNVESKYDTYKINDVVSIYISGKYNDVWISNLYNGQFDFGYTKTIIENLDQEADFQTSYGSVRIDNVNSQASELIIESKHTDYKLYPAGAVNLDIEGEYTSVKYPDNLDIDHREKGTKELKLKGSNGEGLKVIARMKYGSLKIED